MKNKLIALFWLLSGWAGFAGLAVAQFVLPDASPFHSVGTVNCASSTCHGSVVPWKDSAVLQNEYTTWSKLDKHAKAYNVLQNDQSQKIARNLGLAEPASKSKICLDCHSHNPPPLLRGPRDIVEDGVSCEACHGPAEKWIATHTLRGTTQQDKINDGMYPIRQPLETARLCLSCHFGDENRFVTHRMMAAGHPRLSFEIDTFGLLQPPHYRLRDELTKQNGAGIKTWAIGQALAARQLLTMLVDPKRGRDGLFPELVLFDCNACHHPMSTHQSSMRLGIGPGRVHINDANLLMLRAIVAVIDPAHVGAYDTKLAQLHRAIAQDGTPENDPIKLAKEFSTMLDQVIATLQVSQMNTGTLDAIMHELLSDAAAKNYDDYAGAEQAYMSVAALISSLNQRNGLKNVTEVNHRLSTLRNTLANDEKYSPDTFRAALAELRLSLARKEN